MEGMRQYTAAIGIQAQQKVAEAQKAFVKGDSTMSDHRKREVKSIIDLQREAFVTNESIYEDRFALQSQAWREFASAQQWYRRAV